MTEIMKCEEKQGIPYNKRIKRISPTVHSELHKIPHSFLYVHVSVQGYVLTEMCDGSN